MGKVYLIGAGPGDHKLITLKGMEAIKKAHEEGYGVFDFGRTAPEDTGLMRFKKYWGTNITDLLQAHNKDSTDMIDERESLKWKFIGFLAGNSPLPLYRILSNFCYKHLG